MEKAFSFKHCVARLITAWCFISIVTFGNFEEEGIRVNQIETVGLIDFTTVVIMLLLAWAALFVLFFFIDKIDKRVSDLTEKILLFMACFIYSIKCVGSDGNVYFCVGMTLFMGFAAVYCFKDADISSIKLNKCATITIIAILAVALTILVGTSLAVRCLSYSAPNFDMGIFSQMFHSMKTDFTMRTTCERDKLLSHMCVHVAPDFYLLLPFYSVFSSPAALEVMQIAVVMLAVIPLYFICEYRRLSRLETLCIITFYVFCPVMSGGCYYDIHENMFYPLFLFMFLAFMERDNNVGMLISMLLVWFIKEDAPVFMMFIGLYMMTIGKKRKKGLVVILLSAVYFVFVTTLLKFIGTGIISDGFNNMIYEQNGNIYSIIKTIITNPAYIVTQCFKQNKIIYIMETMGAMLFVPFITRKWQRFILFGPYILFNLMADYEYFHNIFFQFSFGPCAMLLYVAILNVADMKQEKKNIVIPMLAVASVLFFTSIVSPRLSNIRQYREPANREINAKITEGLKMVPKDATVIATTFMCQALSDRKEVYELYYTEKNAEYIVLDGRYQESYYNINEYLKNDRYENVYYAENAVAVFKDRNYSK